MPNETQYSKTISLTLRKEIRQCEVAISNVNDQLADLLTRKRKLEKQLDQSLDKKYG